MPGAVTRRTRDDGFLVAHRGSTREEAIAAAAWRWPAAVVYAGRRRH